MTTDTRPVRRRDDLPSVARLLTVSDNVVAIALTLLALQVKVPPLDQVANPDSAADLAAELAKEAGQLISYLVAFYVIAQFWLTHRRKTGHTRLMPGRGGVFRRQLLGQLRIVKGGHRPGQTIPRVRLSTLRHNYSDVI